MAIQLEAAPLLFDRASSTVNPIDAISGLGARRFPFKWAPTFRVRFFGSAGTSVRIWADATDGMQPPQERATETVVMRGPEVTVNVDLVLGELMLFEPVPWRFRLFADTDLLMEIAVPVERAR